MAHKGKVNSVSGRKIRVDQIEPHLPYGIVGADVESENVNLQEGDEIEFKYNREKRRIFNVKILNREDAGPSQMMAKVEPIEYCAYIANVIEERGIDAIGANGQNWLHKNMAFAVHHAYAYKPDDVRDEWQKWILSSSTRSGIQEHRNSLGGENAGLYKAVARPEFHLDLLPKPSFAISFRFILAKPYISRDEESIYVIYNPVVKDSVFGLPMIRETAWKGHLRQTMREIQNRFPENGGKVTDETIIDRLFGPRDVDDLKDAMQGYLRFYPTFFDDVSLEVINPHSREKRAGDNPILIESVPAGRKGDFFLLYTPIVGLAPITENLSEDDKQKWQECNDAIMKAAMVDLQELVRAIQAMFLKYGFSAKATDGYGRAQNELEQVDSILMLQTNCRGIAPGFNWDDDCRFQTFDAFAQGVREMT